MKYHNEMWEHYLAVENKHWQYGDMFFTALQGSQNYGLSDDKSDIDTKSLIIPSLWSTLFNKPLTETIILDNGEHADVKDIREMFRMFEKQNVNFIEILFSPYVIVNKDYDRYYRKLVTMREPIAFAYPRQTILANLGHIREKIKKFDNSTVTTAADVEKYGYDPKQLHHMYRLQDFLERFVDAVEDRSKETYADILLHPHKPQSLINMKRGAYSFRRATEMRAIMVEWANEFEYKYIDGPDALPKEPAWDMTQFFNDLSYEMIKRLEDKQK